MATTWQWTGFVLLLFFVGCSPTSNVVESPPQSPDDTAVDTTGSVDGSMSTEATRNPEISAVNETTEPGLSIGTKAPNFVLKNQSGDDVPLVDLLKEHNVALVFYRSADW